MDVPKNLFKQALREGRQQIGLWNTIPDPSVVEALAGAGYDWMLIDTEHTPVEPATVLGLLQATAPYPTQIMVRASVNNTALIKRHLDMGAQSLLIPYVQSREEAQAAVDAVRYGPNGVRGVAGTMRASRFGRIPNYTARADAEICLILQVETALAMERLEEIAGVDGVDGIFIGPADLAASMGHPGELTHPKVTEMIFGAIERLKATGKPSGILTLNAGFARDCIAAGTMFTAVGVDFSLLIKGAEQLAHEFTGR